MPQNSLHTPSPWEYPQKGLREPLSETTLRVAPGSGPRMRPGDCQKNLPELESQQRDLPDSLQERPSKNAYGFAEEEGPEGFPQTPPPWGFPQRGSLYSLSGMSSKAVPFCGLGVGPGDLSTLPP
eukprot:RCo007728